MIWLLAIPALAAVFALGAAARALILAWTRPPRHAADPELRQPSEDDVHTFLGALPPWDMHDQPAPGETIYTDHSVWLPRTPQTSPAGPAPGMTPNPSAPGGSSTGHHTANPRENRVSDRPGTPPHGVWTWNGDWTWKRLAPAPDPDADVEEWRHILAPAERLATDTDVRASARCACGQPAGHLEDTLRTGSLDVIGHAFDTAQFGVIVDA